MVQGSCMPLVLMVRSGLCNLNKRPRRLRVAVNRFPNQQLHFYESIITCVCLAISTSDFKTKHGAREEDASQARRPNMSLFYGRLFPTLYSESAGTYWDASAQFLLFIHLSSSVAVLTCSDIPRSMSSSANVEPEPQLPLEDYRRYGRQMILDGFGLDGRLPRSLSPGPRLLLPSPLPSHQDRRSRRRFSLDRSSSLYRL